MNPQLSVNRGLLIALSVLSLTACPGGGGGETGGGSGSSGGGSATTGGGSGTTGGGTTTTGGGSATTGGGTATTGGATATAGGGTARPGGGTAPTGGGTATTGGGTGSTGGGAPSDGGCVTLNFSPGQEAAIQDAVNSLVDCTTIELAAGTYHFDNALTIRSQGSSTLQTFTLRGAGKGTQGQSDGSTTATVLDFTNAVSNSNGVDIVANALVVEDLAIWNAKKDALRVENSDGVILRRVRTEWATENATSNGAYGLYPVSSTHVLMEDCEAYNAADAGIYVGQTTFVTVRNCIAKKNVAGIEIENTRFADVYGNLAEDNTTGLVVFDLPSNPVAGSDIRVHHNTVINNNRANFAAVNSSSSTVSQVPAGTGSFVMASRRVEFFSNTWSNNDTVDFAVISGLSITGFDPTPWTQGNFAVSNIYVHDNVFVGGSGDNIDADPSSNRILGVFLGGLYGFGVATAQVPAVEPVIWDGVDPDGQPNHNNNEVNLCFTNNDLDAGQPYAVANLNFPASVPYLLTYSSTGDAGALADAWGTTSRATNNATPYNCTGITIDAGYTP